MWAQGVYLLLCICCCHCLIFAIKMYCKYGNVEIQLNLFISRTYHCTCIYYSASYIESVILIFSTSLFDCQTYLDTTLGLAAFYVKRENIVIFFVIRNYPETPHDINTQKVQNQHMWCHIIKIDVIRLLAKYVINLINVLNGFRYICTF